MNQRIIVRSASCISLALAAVLSISISGIAAAQDATGSSSGTFVLEEIIVTATRREASIQDVALSVSAVTGKQLEMMGADNIQEYYRVVPNLVRFCEVPRAHCLERVHLVEQFE